MLMLAAHHTQNSSIGAPCRSDSGIGSIPWVSMLQTRSLRLPSRGPLHFDAHGTPSVGDCRRPRFEASTRMLVGHYAPRGAVGSSTSKIDEGPRAVRSIRVPHVDRDAT